jgi:hypothetical protein
MSIAIKPRVHWKPAESRWAVQDGKASVPFETWGAAFRYAHLAAIFREG